jgi:hypothetical protein
MGNLFFLVKFGNEFRELNKPFVSSFRAPFILPFSDPSQGKGSQAQAEACCTNPSLQSRESERSISPSSASRPLASFAEGLSLSLTGQLTSVSLATAGQTVRPEHLHDATRSGWAL